MSAYSIFFRYTMFAVMAILVNLGTQMVELHLYQGPMDLTIAMVLGTGTGLLTKYFLDARWIFSAKSTGVIGHSKKFVLYTATGVLTTALFWGLEYAFDALTPSGRWRYLGAIIGLAIGYVTKYQLDRRFVFARAPR